MIPLPDAATARKWAWRILLLAVIAYVAYVVREIWVPLILAFLLATVLDPIVDRLELRGWTRAAAGTLIYSVFLFVVIGGSILIYPHVAAQVQEIQQGVAKYFPDSSPPAVKQSLFELGAPASVVNPLVRVYKGLVEGYSTSSAGALNYLAQLGTNLLWMIIVPIIAFYALLDYHLILAKGLLLVPRRYRDVVQTAVSETTAIFAKYLRAMLIISILDGLATWLLLWILGVPGALVIGILAVIAYNVPFIGAFVINVLTAGIAFLHGGFELMMLATVLGLVLHHIAFDQIVAPKVLGGQVGLHPILAIIALLVGNILIGILGMVLAVPVAACIQIGVLALVPKLRHEIELPQDNGSPPRSVDEIAGETLEVHAKTDATEELHRGVAEAVESIEERVDSA